MDEDKLRIGEVAAQAGVRKSAIRYYESLGLLAEPERSAGQRLYEKSVLRRLAVIGIGQRAGLSLDEIGTLLEAGNEPMSARLREIAANKLPEIEALLRRAEAMRQWLKAAEGCGCAAIDDCVLFDAETIASGGSQAETALLQGGATRSSQARLKPRRQS